MHLHSAAPTTIVATAWGPGAECALDEAADLVGADDVAPSLAGVHPVVTELARRLVGLRIGRTGAVLDTLVPVVLAQRVIGVEARDAYRAMVRAAGREAPDAGPVSDPIAARMLLPPTAGWLATTPSSTFHRWGVEAKRATTITTAAGHAPRLDELPQLPLDEARRRLAALPGVGPWTANTVAMLALGDPDAVAVGDYWLKHVVSFALTGEARGTDERMLELLEPWRGHAVGYVACCYTAHLESHVSGRDCHDAISHDIERPERRSTGRDRLRPATPAPAFMPARVQ